MSTKTYEIFHSISGIEVNTPGPGQIGDFTFYQFPRDQFDAVKQYVPDLDSTMCSSLFLNFRDIPSVVGVKVKASDVKTAGDVARSYFIRLTNLFSFFLLESREICNVSVFGTERITRDANIILSKAEIHREFSISGIRQKLELSKLLQADPFFRNLITELTDTNLTEMRRKVLLSIDFCGLAIQGIGQPSGFVQAVTALECLFSTGRGNIASTISDNCAFILGDNFSNRVKMKEKVKELYRKRSNLAHGKISCVSKEECLEAIFYAKNAINAFLVDDALKNIKSGAEFNLYIDRLKFGAKEGENA